MQARDLLNLLLLGLGSLPASGYGEGVGVLVVRTATEPRHIAPGEKAIVRIDARDGFQRPLSGVSLKISADTGNSGLFESNNKPAVQGSTDERGEFRAVWLSDRRVETGVRTFTIVASKGGYLGRYPLTASIVVETAPKQPADSPEPPVSGPGEYRFDGALKP